MKEIRLYITVFSFFILLIWVALPLNAQEKKIEVYDLSLSELSKLKVSTATKSEQEFDEIQSTVRVIEQKEIQERGYFTLDDVLSDLPGFQFRNIMSLNSYVFQRGIPNQNNLTLLLVDGVQINELNSGGFYAGAQYNLSDIERIEVVYGPSSVAYGTNAVSGVINIITKEAHKNEGSLTALMGAFNTYLSDFSFAAYNEKKKLGFRVAGMYKQSDKANLKGKEGDFNWSETIDNFENDYSLSMKVTYKDFTFGNHYFQKQTSTATTYPSVGTHYRDYGTSWNILFLNNYLRYEKPLKENLKLTATLYNRNATVLKNTIYFVLDTAQVGYYRPNNLTGLEAVLDFRASKKLSVTGGAVAEYEHLSIGPTLTYSNSADSRPPIPQKPPQQANSLLSLFIEPNIVLFNSLYLSGGIRFDQSSVYDQVLTPKAGFRYNLDNYSIRFNYAEAFRAPKPWDYTDGMGNPNLKPEHLHAFETSINVLAIKNVNFEINVYRNNLSNGIFKENVGESYRWINSSKVITNGAEFCLRYNGKRINGMVNYTVTDSKDGLGKRLPEISTHCINGGITYLLSQKFTINIRCNYVGERDNPKIIKTTNSHSVDGFLIVNGAINWQPMQQLTLAIVGKNILDQEYYHTSNRLPDRYRQPQRTIMFSVNYNFNLDEEK